MQIGNFHFGRYDTAIKPTLSAGEAYTLWDNLVARYDWDDSLEVFYNYAYDTELKDLIYKMINLLRKQSLVIEDQMAHFQLPLPYRPREIIKFQTDSGVVKDEFIFRRLFTGLQDFLAICSVAIKTCVVNDSLRELFIKLLREKMDEFNELCVFGKQKDWLQIPPQMPIG